MTITFDTAKKSPAITVSGGGLVATGPSSGYGVVLSTDGVASGTGYFAITATAAPAGDTFWVGIASAAHNRGDSGQSWAGGDAASAGLYNSGVLWAEGQTQIILGPSYGYASGDVVRIDIDRDAGLFYLKVNGLAGPRGYALPAGTIYGAVGLDHPASVATADFSGLGSGGGSVIAVTGTTAGAGAAAGLGVMQRSLSGSAAGAGATSGAAAALRNLAGTAGGLGAGSGVWDAGAPGSWRGVAQGIAEALGLGLFPGAVAGAWTPTTRRPAVWTPATPGASAWTRTSV